MKKFLLLFASVLSLALAAPSRTYAAVSVSDLSDADQGKTVDVSGYFVNTFLSDDYDCMSGRWWNNLAWREQEQYSRYTELLGPRSCIKPNSPFAILSTDTMLARKPQESQMEQHDRQRTYYEEKGYESVDSITKTSSGDLLLYMSKDFMKNVTASPEYQEKCRELGTAEWGCDQDIDKANIIALESVLGLEFVELHGTYVHIKGVFPYENDFANNGGKPVEMDMQILIVDSIKILDQEADEPERIPFKDGDTTTYIRSITKSASLLAQYDLIDRKLANIEKLKSTTLPKLLAWMDTLAKAKKVCMDRVKANMDTYENWIPYVVAKTNALTKSASATIDAKYLRLAGPSAAMLAKTDSLSTTLSDLSSSDIRTAYPDLSAVFDRADKKIMGEIARGMDKALYQKYLDDASNADLGTLFTETKWEVIESMYESRLKAEAAKGYESSR